MPIPAPSIGQFSDRNSLINHVRTFGASNGYGVSIVRSKKNKVYLGYNWGGIYRNRLNLNDQTCQRNTSSRLIDCPFSVYGIKRNDNMWILTICNSEHNHEPSENISAHPSFRRPNEQAQGQIKEMSNA
ncbi:10987_t:CDS:1, partial [Cetraspora pellucida]